MDVPVPRNQMDVADESSESAAVVTCHEPRPGKLVLTERNNTDGWIATDLAVDLEP